MVKARAAAQAQPPIVEELHFRSDNAFLCLLLNRRTKQIRVIDFRAGALPAKRLFIQSVAQREGVEKVIILVEKDEVSSWTRVGFVREGTVPGFYKRSDGHLVGCVIGDKTASIEVTDAVQKAVDRTINAAKKKAKDYPESLKGVGAKTVTQSAAETARDAVWKKGDHTLGSFDAFGRDAARLYVEATPKKGKPAYLSAEFQDCFGHSLIEILKAPKDEKEVLPVVAGLRALNEDLKAREIVSAFSFAPFDNVELSTAFVAAGYRKTGLLARGALCNGERTDAILWTRKLADPSGGADMDDDMDE
ncbi:MAG: hypothetical protein OXU20_06535 [Myxococcales bacterium]|nr:hypothetical protein [Myxococcales bacterium]MDD9968640.1 hypothetical protein [Myxococcales bacterium]